MYARKTTIFDTTTESPEVIFDNLTEVEVEPKEFSDSSRNASKENEVASNNSELLQYFDKYPENKTGEFKSVI